MTTPETVLTVDYRISLTIPRHLDDLMTGPLWAACAAFEAALRDYGVPGPYNITLDSSHGEHEVFDGTSDCTGCR